MERISEARPEVGAADVAARIRTVVGRLSRRLRLTQAGNNLTPSQLDVLGTVVRRGPLGLSRLASLEGVNPSMLSRIAGHLESFGLVERTADPNDARGAWLAATEKGKAVHDQLRTERTEALIVAINRLSHEQRRRLTAALPAIEALVDELRDAQC